MNNLQFDDDTFDWVWSANCAGYAPVEPLPLLKELARVVKPGGSVIIIAWSSQQLLPGYPVLEAHLNATFLDLIAYSLPVNHSLIDHHLHLITLMRPHILKIIELDSLTAPNIPTRQTRPTPPNAKL